MAPKPKALKLGDFERVETTLSPEAMAALDQWRREHPDNPPQAKALRELFELGLTVKRKRAA